MSGTHIDLLFCSASLIFAWITHRWGLCPTETCNYIKQHELHQIYKPLWVPELTCLFVHAISMISTGITCLCGCQPSSVVFWYKTATFGPEWQVSIGLRPHLSFCTCKTERLVAELLVSMGARPHLWFLDAKQRLRCFACKNHWWRQGPIENNNSGGNHAVLHVQNDRLYLWLT